MSLAERVDFESLVDGDSRFKLERKFARDRILKDPMLFVDMCGYRDLGKFHEKEIRDIFAFKSLESHPIRRLWFWSRGFFKTSLITEAHTLWLIIHNPDIRVLIVSFSLEVAKKPLGAIRQQFISNELFRYFFFDFCPKANKENKIEFGTSEYFTIPNRSRNLKEPTVMCAGIGTNITGLHFDAMKIDDLVNKDSVTNDTQIQSSKDYYSLLRPIFDNPTTPREDVIGTIYHFNDLHSNLLENKEFKKSLIPAYDETGFKFPERLDEVGWESLINDSSINPYDIQRQWLLRPINPKDAKFREEWIKYYDETPEELAQYICVDPASTQKKKSDYTVIESWGVDSQGKHFLLEAIRDKLTSFQRIDRLFQFVKNSKNLKWVNYEVLGGRHGDLEVIKERQAREQLFFMIKETKSTTSSKEDRITQRLQGAYNSGCVYLPRTLIYKSEFDNKTHDFIQEFKLELLQFPFTEHDDILDCQSQMFQEELVRGKRTKIKEKREWGTADDWDKLYKDLQSGRATNPFITDEQIRRKLLVKRFKKIVRAG